MKTVAFPKSQSIRNAATLITGTVISQVIPFAAAPILTRIYIPENYGTLGLFIAVTALLGIITTLQYSTAIVLPSDDSVALALVKGCIVILSIVAGCALITVPVILSLVHNDAIESLGVWIWLIPLSAFLIGLNLTFTNLANRFKLYRILSRNRVFTALASAATSILIGGFLFRGASGLILGYLTGQAVASIVLIYSISKQLPESLFRNYRAEQIKAALCQYKNFPKYSLITEFINGLINQLPVFILGKLTGKASVGFYNMSNRMLGLPIVVFTSAVGDVFKQKAAEDFHRNGECRTIFLKTFKTLFLLSIVPFGLLAIFGADIFALFFGEPWRRAGVYAQVMGILFFFRFIVSPLSFVYYIRGNQREDFLLHILMLIIGFASFYWGYIFFEDTVKMLLIYSIGYSIIYLIYFIRSYQLSKGR